MSTFEKATKQKSRLRCALFGPSGAGKTYSALRIASGIGGKVAVIDTEHGSASKYADRFDFDVAELNTDKSIDALCHTLAAATDYDVVVIDSLSHSWQELLGEIDRIAKTKYRGNTWSAWSEGTPKQKALIEALLDCPAHVIATIRSKTAWEQETDTRTGKTKPVRVGLAPEQGKGIEYEFDLLLEIGPEHIAQVIKDRTGKWQDQMIDKPDEAFGAALRDWLSDGAAPNPPPAAKPPPKSTETAALSPEKRAKGYAVLEAFAVDHPARFDELCRLEGVAESRAMEKLSDAELIALAKRIKKEA